MRFLLILVGVGTLIYFVGRKAVDTFWLKDVDKDVKAAFVPKDKPKETKGVLEGGSIVSSINSSLNLGKDSDKPLIYRTINFRFRELPSAQTITALETFGVRAVLDPSARTLLLQGPFDVVNEIGNLLESSDKVPGTCAMRGWIVWVSDADREGWEFTSELGMSVEDNFRASFGSDVLLSAGVDEISAALKIMASETRISVVQEPHIHLTDAVESRIESLEEVPIPETTLSNGLASESISYKRVGLELIVKPMFLPNDRVRLSVTQIGGLVGRTAEIKDSEIPVLQTQKVSSDVELAVGQSLVLGGVRSTRTKVSKGWFSNSDELETGILYVVVALYHDAPKAILVDLEWESQVDALIDNPGEVLPPLKD